jgi:hypothetical protein
MVVRDAYLGVIPGANCSEDQIWFVADQRGTHRVVIEADAGCGKTNLVQHFAREQIWGDRFGANLVFDLEKLRDAGKSFKSFGLQEVLKLSDIPDKFHATIEENSEFILWIWDGYERVDEFRSSGSFGQFLSGLGSGTVSWAPRCIITARPEKETVFENTTEFTLRPWTKDDVDM